MSSVELGAVVAHTLARMGVAGVVSGAGSRNAPLSMAFHRLDADGALSLHVVVDPPSVLSDWPKRRKSSPWWQSPADPPSRTYTLPY